MTHDNKSSLKTVRIIALCAFIAISIGTFNNIVFGTDNRYFQPSLLYPYTIILVPLTNGVCALLSFILFLFPQYIVLIAVIGMIESTLDVLTGFSILGTFIYAYCFMILFCLGYGQSNFKKKAYIVCIWWALTLLTLPFSYGMSDFLFAIGLAIFATSTYISIYRLLYDKLNFLISSDTANSEKKPLLNLPEKGSILNLNSLGLTQRQIACIHYTLETTKSYKQIAQEQNISESAIKKDMFELYKLFGVKNREMLRLALFQYKIN